MKTVKKNVYYCDFCKKKGLSAPVIARHEKHCTANPDRECKPCKESRDIKTFIEKLKSRFEIKETIDQYTGFTNQEVIWKGYPITLIEILEFTDECPNCTLAVLRQTKLNYSVFNLKYDYQTSLKEWWKEKNNEEYGAEMRSYY